MAHTLTFNGDSVEATVNGEDVISPYTLQNNDEIVLSHPASYLIINGTPYTTSAQRISLSDTDINVTLGSRLPGGFSIRINYTEAPSTPRKSVDLSTLSGWAGLSSGAHSIQLKAKAAGYRDSELSQAVSVTKEAQSYQITGNISISSNRSYGEYFRVYDGDENGALLYEVLGGIPDVTATKTFDITTGLITFVARSNRRENTSIRVSNITGELSEKSRSETADLYGVIVIYNVMSVGALTVKVDYDP